MKIFLLYLVILASGCAVQGPISGGPIDVAPPQLVSVYPENFSTSISLDETIILYFDESIDPLSAQKAITINRDKYSLKVNKKKILIRPEKAWNPSERLDIYINRDITDYQNNHLFYPINLIYSFDENMPTGNINGEIIDIMNIKGKKRSISFQKYKNTGNTFSNDFGKHGNQKKKKKLPSQYYPKKGKKEYNPKNSYELGLYRYVNSETELTPKIFQTDIYNQFKIYGLEDGKYRLVVVRGKLIDIAQDVLQKSYSILSSSYIEINNQNNSADVLFKMGGPIKEPSLSSINFINQYYVDYIFSDGREHKTIIDTVYNNFHHDDFTGDTLTVFYYSRGQFEPDTTQLEFVVPNIIDTIPPTIEHERRNSLEPSKFMVVFSEPVFSSDSLEPNIFYTLKDDSTRNYLESSIRSTDSRYPYPLARKSIERILHINDEDSVIYIAKDMIKDLSGNILEDSLIYIPELELDNDEERGAGGIAGNIIYSGERQVVVVARNVRSKSIESKYQLTKNNTFYFLDLLEGLYYLQCYENYKDDRQYLYYPGNWEPFSPSLKFSKLIGPIEVRNNWDVEDIIINLDEPTINYNILEEIDSE